MRLPEQVSVKRAARAARRLLSLLRIAFAAERRCCCRSPRNSTSSSTSKGENRDSGTPLMPSVSPEK